MPTYKYECTSCKHTEDKFQKINEEKLVTCSVCGKDTYQVVVQAVGFRTPGKDYCSRGKV